MKWGGRNIRKEGITIEVMPRETQLPAQGHDKECGMLLEAWKSKSQISPATLQKKLK